MACGTGVVVDVGAEAAVGTDADAPGDQICCVAGEISKCVEGSPPTEAEWLIESG